MILQRLSSAPKAVAEAKVLNSSKRLPAKKSWRGKAPNTSKIRSRISASSSDKKSGSPEYSSAGGRRGAEEEEEEEDEEEVKKEGRRRKRRRGLTMVKSVR